MNKFEIANALSVVYKAQIINFLISLGLEYDEGMNYKNLKDRNFADIKLKKFLAWKKEIDRFADYQNFEMSNALSHLAEYIYYLKSEGYKDLKFNLRDVEGLIDKDSFVTLFRTCIVFEGTRGDDEE